MNTEPDWQEVHDGLAKFLILCIIAFWIFLAAMQGCNVGAQLAPLPMPPDILLAKPSCELLEYEAAEVLDAKTGETEERTRFLVLPFATYSDHRPRWTLPEEPLITNPDIKHIGSIDNVATAHEAIDSCFVWIRAVRAKQAELRKKAPK